MEYTINVARPMTKRDSFYRSGDYIHYFKVTVPYGSVRRVYEELKEKFPDCKIDVTVWQKVGESIDMDKCNF